MNGLLTKSFDFAIRLVVMADCLKGEGKEIPFIKRLLDCGTGIGASLRIAKSISDGRKENQLSALGQAVEAEYLIELMVKTGFLTEFQSEPILLDCRTIIEEINSLMGKTINNRTKKNTDLG